MDEPIGELCVRWKIAFVKDLEVCMKVHFSTWFPFGKFCAINLFGHLIVKWECWKRKTDRQAAWLLNHEAIHSEQMKELWYVPFYLIYFVEWLYWAVFRTKKAYRHINFEKEAYNHQSELGYCETRKRFAQWKSTK